MIDIEKERPAFEQAMNTARFFPRELNFAMGKSPSGRDEYANGHLESCWTGWLAAKRHAAQVADIPAQGGIDNAQAGDKPGAEP